MLVSILGQGLGYSLANLFASKGVQTIGLDIRKESFENPRLDSIMKSYIEENKDTIEKNIKYTTNYDDISDSDLVFCFVETPLESINRLGINSVKKATKAALDVIKDDCTFVMMSTLPVGGTKTLFDEFGEKLSNRYVYCPPMVRQVDFLQNYVKPPYLLLGGKGEAHRKKVHEFLRKFIENDPPVWETIPANVEICKLATNAYAAMKGIFFNRLADYAKANGADPKMVCKMVASHNVVGIGYTEPAGDIGGVCLPRDMKELYNATTDQGLSQLLKKIEELNTPFQ